MALDGITRGMQLMHYSYNFDISYKQFIPVDLSLAQNYHPLMNSYLNNSHSCCLSTCSYSWILAWLVALPIIIVLTRAARAHSMI